MPSSFISGGSLSSLLCSVPVHHCFCLLERVVDWCVSRLVRLICCQIIWMASSLEVFHLSLTCHPSPSLFTFVVRSGQRDNIAHSYCTLRVTQYVRHLLLDLEPYGGTDPFGMFPHFLKRTADVLAPILVLYIGGLFVWVVYRHARDRPMSPQFRKVHRPPCCQLPTDFHNFSIV